VFIRFESNLNFPYRSQRTPNTKFHKNPSNNRGLVPCGQTDGQTDMTKQSLFANVRTHLKRPCHVDNLLRCNKVLSEQVRVGEIQREIKHSQVAGVRRHINISTCICNGPTNALVCNKTLIQMSHTKTTEITPTCFDHQITIIRELFDPG
jgi:hypothetical protein